jgi:polysaccharide deacetylase family protein (PEP-CTERM system associated)
MEAHAAPPPCHALSVDVEDWYHDAAGIAGSVGHRVEANTDRLLEMFADHGARATFFFLGAVAQRFPALVRRAADQGHEIGSHGYDHRPLPHLLRREFRADVERSLRLLEDLTGTAVRGYRAPYFSIKAGVHWPIEALQELGLAYDSSILAIDRPPGLELVSPRRPYRHPSGVLEVPVAVLRFFVWHLPLASGAGLRLAPSRFVHRRLEVFEREVGAGVFYLHPWELDPASPTGDGRGRWLLRVGRARLAERLGELLRRRRFAPIAEVFAAELDA